MCGDGARAAHGGVCDALGGAAVSPPVARYAAAACLGALFGTPVTGALFLAELLKAPALVLPTASPSKPTAADALAPARRASLEHATPAQRRALLRLMHPTNR